MNISSFKRISYHWRLPVLGLILWGVFINDIDWTTGTRPTELATMTAIIALVLIVSIGIDRDSRVDVKEGVERVGWMGQKLQLVITPS